MRQPLEGALPENIRATQNERNNALNMLETLLEFKQRPLVIRQLIPAHKELIRPRASLRMTAIATEQQEAA